MARAVTLGDLPRVRAEELGDRLAVTFERQSISYEALDSRAVAVARALVSAGLEPQDRVAILDKNTPEYLDVVLGCAKANVVLVPVNWRLAPPEIAVVVNDALAKVLFVGDEFVPAMDKIADDLETVATIVGLGEAACDIHYDDWVASAGTDDPPRPASPDDVVLQVYTSGTTGLPKGVMLTNRNLMTLPTAQAWGVSSDSVVLDCMPLFHLAGLSLALLSIHEGAHLVLQRDADPAVILDAIEWHRVTYALLVPALLQFVLTHPSCSTTDLSSLRVVVYGASPIREDVLRRAIAAFGCAFQQVYGLTESTALGTLLAPSDHDLDGPHPERLRSAGVPGSAVEVRVVDPDSGEDRPIGEVGEVWLRSPGVMKGYWKRPDDTASTITAAGWLRTGDAAYLDGYGYLYVVDRIKDMIVTGGENVYPAEVENVLAAHRGVADVAVIGVPSERWGETVTAIVVRAPGSDVSDSELIGHARTQLAHYKCPTSVDFVDTLPRNPSGKVLKRELRAPYWAGHQR